MQTKCLLLALIVVIANDRTSFAREWTSSGGEYRIEADLVGFDSQRVRLKKADGKIVIVPLEQLGEADQKWIAEIVRKQEAAKSVLEKKGFRVSSDGLQVPEELELKNSLRDLPQLKKPVIDAQWRLEKAQNQFDENKAAIERLIEANQQLNTRLAVINPTQITLNNKLVAALQANKAQIVLSQKRDKELGEQLKVAQANAGHARNEFVEAVMKLRASVVSIVSKYEESANDKEIIAAVDCLNEATPGTYALGESRTLAASIRQLEKLEDQIYSEAIPLRDESGRRYVSVVINGKHSHEMIVDAGASLVILPIGVANQCGIQVKASDPTAVLTLADGKKIPGKVVTLESIRVGQFTAKDVKCAVLGIEALNAKPLLGKNFLDNFKYEIDTQSNTMTLIEIAQDGKKPGA